MYDGLYTIKYLKEHDKTVICFQSIKHCGSLWCLYIILYLLKLYIKATDRPVFHLNYSDSGKLAEELKIYHRQYDTENYSSNMGGTYRAFI